MKISQFYPLIIKFNEQKEEAMQGLSSRAKCPIRSLSSTDDENERIGHLAREDVQGPPPPLGLLVIQMFFTRISVTENCHVFYLTQNSISYM